MKKSILTLASIMLLVTSANAQKVEFEEYDLNNGMHVILHQDKSAPVVITSVMYGRWWQRCEEEKNWICTFL